MNLQITAQDLDLTDKLRNHVALRIAYAMNHGQDAVSRVVVRLSGVNGQRGGEDKSCSIEVRVTGSRTLIVSETQVDLYIAIDRAAERIGRALDRHLSRRRVFHAGSATRRQIPTDETR